MKKLLLFLSLVLLVSCSSTRQPDNTAYYKNYFSSASLENSVVDQPVVPDTNYTDTNSTINVNLYTNSYWNSNNIYTNHWPYTNNIYSNDYYGYYSYYTPLYYNYYPYNGYNCWYGYQPHHYHLGNTYSYGWGRRGNSPTRYYTQNYSPRNIYNTPRVNTPRTNYNNTPTNTPRTNYNNTPRTNYNTPRTNTTPSSPRSYNNTPSNTPRTNTTPSSPRSYNNTPSNNIPNSGGGRTSGGRTSGGRR